MSSAPLSEGFVALNRPHNTPGVMVHKEPTGGFITLYAVPYWDMNIPPTENNDVNIENQITIRVTIGHNKNALVARTFTCPHTICHDLWVAEGDEVYVSASIVNRLAVYGHSSERPVSMLNK